MLGFLISHRTVCRTAGAGWRPLGVSGASLMTVAVLMVAAAPVKGQRLLSVFAQTSQPVTVDGVLDQTLEGPSFAVQVDLDLLRGGPPRLELPTPDGRALVAELSVFEDRGGGDLLWAGSFPGAGYESVVLTVAGGRMVGRFGEPGGAQYRISSRPDGAGEMTDLAVPRESEEVPYCPVGSVGDPSLTFGAVGAVRAAAADPPRRIATAQNHDRLDIVVLYTADAARSWANRGGARAAIRNAGDYLNMVFRNGGLGVSANVVHMAQAPAALDRVGRDGVGSYDSFLLGQLIWDGEVFRLRSEHEADLVHLFTGEAGQVLGACGQAYLLTRGTSAEDFSERAYGWTSTTGCGDDAAVFAHEIGHGLGANHDPDNAGPPDIAVHPFAFAHANHGRIPNIGTIMSYPGQTEPYLSSVRIKPQGRVIGVARERENERALRDTIHTGVRYSDSLASETGAPAPPTNVRVEMASATSVRVTWRDNAADADSYEVTYYRTGTDTAERPASGRTEAVLDLTVANPGTRYLFWVNAVRGEVRSLRSGIVTLVTPGAEPEVPSGASLISVVVPHPYLGTINVGLVRWEDNSDDESGFEIHVLAGGEVVARRNAAADTEVNVITGFQIGVPYSVRVYAESTGGVSPASVESAATTWSLASAPSAVTDLTVSAAGPTSVRLNWTDNSTDELGFRVSVFVSGWYGKFEADADTESLEIEGLARGGSYVFLVWPYSDSGDGVTSGATLTLGAAGVGPKGPSRLRWGVTDGVARLTWSDNSPNEMGFEIQSREETPSDEAIWTRVALVPASASSFDFERSEEVDYRVFAYNETGFSASSNTVRGMPFDSGDGPAPGEGLLTAKPVGETSVELTWTGRWARAARGTLGIEARNPAGGWVEVATAVATMAGTVVEGLEAETPYTFRLRAGLTGAAADYTEEASATTGAYAGACREGSEVLCLRDGRFEVRAHWSKPDDDSEYGAGSAAPVEISDESGLFWFFEPENIELVVKVLDGRTINGSYWVFFGALSDVEYWITVRDAASGERQTYHNPPGEVCGQKDLVAFSDATVSSGRQAAGGLGPGGPGIDLLRMNAVPLDVNGIGRASHGGGHCEAGDYRLCLLDGRFSVEVGFVDPNGETGLQEPAKVISSLAMEKTGFFWFFSPSNIELAVKMLDGRGLNSKFWLLYGGLSDVEYEITVTDTVTGSAKTYRNEAGSICGVIDTEAF